MCRSLPVNLIVDPCIKLSFATAHLHHHDHHHHHHHYHHHDGHVRMLLQVCWLQPWLRKTVAWCSQRTNSCGWSPRCCCLCAGAQTSALIGSRGICIHTVLPLLLGGGVREGMAVQKGGRRLSVSAFGRTGAVRTCASHCASAQCVLHSPMPLCYR
jgi:hypothetical protein